MFDDKIIRRSSKKMDFSGKIIYIVVFCYVKGKIKDGFTTFVPWYMT